MNRIPPGSYKYPVCLHPCEIVSFLNSFVRILDSLPAGKDRIALESLYAEFKERMEVDGVNKYEQIVPSETPVKTNALLEIHEIISSLCYIMPALFKTNEDEFITAYRIFLPSIMRLEGIVHCEFPSFIKDLS